MVKFKALDRTVEPETDTPKHWRFRWHRRPWERFWWHTCLCKQCWVAYVVLETVVGGIRCLGNSVGWHTCLWKQSWMTWLLLGTVSGGVRASAKSCRWHPCLCKTCCGGGVVLDNVLGGRSGPAVKVLRPPSTVFGTRSLHSDWIQSSSPWTLTPVKSGGSGLESHIPFTFTAVLSPGGQGTKSWPFGCGVL